MLNFQWRWEILTFILFFGIGSNLITVRIKNQNSVKFLDSV